MEEKRNKNTWLHDLFRHPLVTKIIAAGVLVAVVVAACSLLWKKIVFPNIFESKEGKVTTVSTASLKEIIGMKELATLKNFYNSYVTVYDLDGETVKYYVAYEGTIRMGIDFNKIKVDTDQQKKLITISLPKAEIQDVNVNPDSMDYIFKGDFYETETVSGEAFQECNRDLQKKAEKEDKLLVQAEENAKDAVSAFIQPLKENLDSGYKIKIEFEE